MILIQAVLLLLMNERKLKSSRPSSSRDRFPYHPNLKNTQATNELVEKDTEKFNAARFHSYLRHHLVLLLMMTLG